MKIPIEQIEFEEWASTSEVGALYNDQPFTGIAYGNEENIYYEWCYQNGRAHGRWFEKDQNFERIVVDGRYINGSRVGIHKKNRGELEMTSDFDKGRLIEKRILDSKGVVLLDYNEKENLDREYYDDGTIYRKTIVVKGRGYSSFYLGSEEKWMFKEVVKEKEYEYPGAPYKHRTIYNTSLIFDQLHFLDAKFHIRVLEKFSEFLLERDTEQAMPFFMEMIKHKDPFIKNKGVYYLGELKNPDAIPFLEEIRDQEKGRLILLDRFSELD